MIVTRSFLGRARPKTGKAGRIKEAPVGLTPDAAPGAKSRDVDNPRRGHPIAGWLGRQDSNLRMAVPKTADMLPEPKPARPKAAEIRDLFELSEYQFRTQGILGDKLGDIYEIRAGLEIQGTRIMMSLANFFASRRKLRFPAVKCSSEPEI